MIAATCNSRSLDPCAHSRERGFTLLELVVAMAVFGMIGLGIFGVLVMGARAAGSGQRVSGGIGGLRTTGLPVSVYGHHPFAA